MNNNVVRVSRCLEKNLLVPPSPYFPVPYSLFHHFLIILIANNPNANNPKVFYTKINNKSVQYKLYSVLLQNSILLYFAVSILLSIYIK